MHQTAGGDGRGRLNLGWMLELLHSRTDRPAVWCHVLFTGALATGILVVVTSNSRRLRPGWQACRAAPFRDSKSCVESRAAGISGGHSGLPIRPDLEGSIGRFQKVFVGRASGNGWLSTSPQFELTSKPIVEPSGGERLSAPDRWRERASGAGLGLIVGILAFKFGSASGLVPRFVLRKFLARLLS